MGFQGETADTVVAQLGRAVVNLNFGGLCAYPQARARRPYHVQGGISETYVHKDHHSSGYGRFRRRLRESARTGSGSGTGSGACTRAYQQCCAGYR